jgi:hypothetical protein
MKTILSWFFSLVCGDVNTNNSSNGLAQQCGETWSSITPRSLATIGSKMFSIYAGYIYAFATLGLGVAIGLIWTGEIQGVDRIIATAVLTPMGSALAAVLVSLEFYVVGVPDKQREDLKKTTSAAGFGDRALLGVGYTIGLLTIVLVAAWLFLAARRCPWWTSLIFTLATVGSAPTLGTIGMKAIAKNRLARRSEI